MTYQSFWGFTSYSDDLCVKEPILPSSYLGLPDENQNVYSFAFKFKVSSLMMKATDGKHGKYKISGDHESFSSVQLSRFCMKQESVIGYPVLGEPHFVMFTTEKTPSIPSALANCPLSFDVVEVNEAQDGDDEINVYGECADNQHLKHCIVFGVLDLLLRNGYTSFATDDQLNGVVARPFKHGNSNALQVFAIKTCVINPDGEGHLTVEAHYYRYIPLKVPDILYHSACTEAFEVAQQVAAVGGKRKHFESDGDEGERREGESGNEKRDDFAATATFMPTTEEVAIKRLIPYDVPATFKAAKTVTNNVFLTPFDVLNRRKGYSLFLPNTYEAYRLYWDLAHGVQLPAGGTAQRRVVLAHITTALGDDRIVPVESLCKSTAELSARSKLHAAEMAASLFADLQSSACCEGGDSNRPLFHTLSPPVPTHEYRASVAAAEQSRYASSAVTEEVIPRVAIRGVEEGSAAHKFKFMTALGARKTSVAAVVGSNSSVAPQVVTPANRFQKASAMLQRAPATTVAAATTARAPAAFKPPLSQQPLPAQRMAVEKSTAPAVSGATAAGGKGLPAKAPQKASRDRATIAAAAKSLTQAQATAVVAPSVKALPVVAPASIRAAAPKEKAAKVPTAAMKPIVAAAAAFKPSAVSSDFSSSSDEDEGDEGKQAESRVGGMVASDDDSLFFGDGSDSDDCFGGGGGNAKSLAKPSASPPPASILPNQAPVVPANGGAPAAVAKKSKAAATTTIKDNVKKKPPATKKEKK